jgi:hypothetical protein
MAALSLANIRGGKKPLVVEFTSNCAEAAGVLVPIPTWACVAKPKISRPKENKRFEIFMLFVCILLLLILVT